MPLGNDILDTGLSSDLRDLLMANARPVALSANEVLFSEEDMGDALYVILDGRVEISVIGEDGRTLSLNVLAKGSILGEIAILNPGPRTATAKALERSRLLVLSQNDLKRAIAANPQLALDLLHLMGERMRYMSAQLQEHVFKPLPQRLAGKVLQFWPEEPDGRADLRLSHSELADLVGASREAVSKVLSSWRQKGLVKTGRGTIELLDKVALQRIAGA